MMCTAHGLNDYRDLTGHRVLHTVQFHAKISYWTVCLSANSVGLNSNTYRLHNSLARLHNIRER